MDDERARLPLSSKTARCLVVPQVATVDAQHRIKLKSIVEGRDFGNSIEVLSGLDPDDVVVQNPPDSLTDGVPVRVAVPPQKAADKVKST